MPITTIGSDIINATGDTIVAGSTIIESDVQLTGSVADGFPNTTNLKIYNFDTQLQDQTSLLNNQTLTRAGANAATASLDVLNQVSGTAYINTCAAQTSWTSTSTDFNVANTPDTDDFMVGGWVYMPSIPATDTMLWSNSGI